jgi:hypothetical protein
LFEHNEFWYEVKRNNSCVKNEYVNLLKNVLMGNICMDQGEYQVQDILLEELTRPKKEVSEISSIMNKVKSKFLNLWWILEHESNADKLLI